MKFWLSEVDVDGFRCDVAGEVPTDFWDGGRPQLESAKSDVFMLAEASKPELQKNSFDMWLQLADEGPLQRNRSHSRAIYLQGGTDGKVREFPRNMPLTSSGFSTSRRRSIRKTLI